MTSLEITFEVMKSLVAPTVIGAVIWSKKRYTHWKNGQLAKEVLKKQDEKEKAQELADQVDQAKKELTIQLLKIEEETNSIKKEVFANGGGSIKDKVVYIADQVTKLRFGQAVTWEALDVAVWKACEKGEWTYVSPALLEMIGAFKEDMMGLAWVNRIAQEDRDRIFRSWKRKPQSLPVVLFLP